MATVLKFNEWQEFMVENTPESSMVTCPTCNGTGVDYEECCTCGHEKEEPCYECDQTGEIRFGKLSPKGKLTCFSKDKYIERLSEDLKKLAVWTGEDYIKLLNKNGYDLVTVRWGRIKKEKVVPLKRAA